MKQTFIIGVETEKKDFNEWIEEHDKEMYNKAIEDMLELSQEWKDNHGSFLDFQRVLRSKLKEHLT